MTRNISKTIGRKRKKLFPILLFSALLLITLRFSAEIREGIVYGIRFSVTTLVPSIFPFMILADYLQSLEWKNEKRLTPRRRSVFGISPSAISVLLTGFICGFPLGSKSASELYERGEMEKSEAELLCAVSTNPSVAFTLSGVGLAMRGDIYDGIILYVSVISSAILTAMIFKPKTQYIAKIDNITKQKFDISISIKSAGYSSLVISSFVAFFSGVLSLAKALIKSDSLLPIIASFLEVGSACNLISKSSLYTENLSLIFTGYALAFSGLSVHLQSFSFMKNELSRTRYIALKLIQGLICVSILSLLFLIKK